MLSFFRKDRWSPYLVGVLIGVLLVWMFLLGQQIGISSGVARIGALIQEMFSSSHLPKNTNFSKLLSDGVIFNWKVLFVIGLFFGSLLASKLVKEKTPEKNRLWKREYGASKIKRYVVAFIGGFLVMFGARIADGCTSGHAISGGAQLSLTSWIFMIALFGTAIPVSFIVYRKNRRLS